MSFPDLRPSQRERRNLGKKANSKPAKAAERPVALKTKKTAPDRVPQQAENFEHTIRRVVRQRERYGSEKYGQYL